MKTRQKKNTCSLYSQDGMLRIRFTYKGKLIRKALGLPDQTAHRIKAEQIKSTIELAILTDAFELDKLDDYVFNKPKPVEKVTAPKKKYSPDSPKRRPFDSEDIERILEAIKSDQFVSKYSAYKHSHYYPYFLTLALTGMRPAEVIGLRWGKVNLEKRLIEVSEVLARKRQGSTASKSRIRKGTKTGNTRFIPISDRLYNTLVSIKKLSDDPDELVFKSPKGLAIDDTNLNDRVWKPILDGLGLDRRVMYSLRHGVACRAIEQGYPVTEVSALMGHSSVQTTVTHYLHKKAPKTLPDL